MSFTWNDTQIAHHMLIGLFRQTDKLNDTQIVQLLTICYSKVPILRQAHVIDGVNNRERRTNHRFGKIPRKRGPASDGSVIRVAMF